MGDAPTFVPFFPFPPPHDTPPAFLGSSVKQILATKFFWRALAKCGYAIASVILDVGTKRKRFIVFINSCHGHEPTHNLKAGAGGKSSLDRPTEPHGQNRGQSHTLDTSH